MLCENVMFAGRSATTMASSRSRPSRLTTKRTVSPGSTEEPMEPSSSELARKSFTRTSVSPRSTPARSAGESFVTSLMITAELLSPFVFVTSVLNWIPSHPRGVTVVR
jgi:hypothetical protein